MEPQKRRREYALNAGLCQHSFILGMGGDYTGEIADEDFGSGHFGKVAEESGAAGVRLGGEEAGRWVDEDAAVFLVEVFDCTGVWIELDGAGYGAGEFLVGEGDLR